MKTFVLAVILLTLSAPAHAQFGRLFSKAKEALDVVEKGEAFSVMGDEEHRIGAEVSERIRTRFGVVQDSAVHRYVTLVGRALAEQSEKPALPWTFVVLDTDGVNAFAAPGGFVHITRGALGLIKNEAELAGVLGHEIGHIAHQHTVNAIRKANVEELATDAALADRAPFLERFADLAYDHIIEGKFDRDDELDSDEFSVDITRRLGYSASMLGEFLVRLAERNTDSRDRNGLFASHPETTERIEKIHDRAGSTEGATMQARYESTITYDAAAMATISVIEEGSAGLAGSNSDGKEDQANRDDDDNDDGKNEPRKRGFGLGALKRAVTPEAESTQVSASGGSRGVGPDRLAEGGDNPSLVEVTVTPAEVTAFKDRIM